MMGSQFPPLFFSFSKGVVVFYIGASHSKSPKDSQFLFIKKKWDEFLADAKKPSVVVEGRVTKHYQNEVGAITEGGEIAFVAFLARGAHVPVFCFEPPRSKEMKWLAKRFSKEEIAYYYFARIVAQWHRQNKKGDIERYLPPFLERDRKASGWRGFEFSVNHMQEIHRSLFGNDLDFSDADFFRRIENPTREDNPLKGIVRASGEYRDSSIMRGIKKLIEEEHDVFIVYGRGHAEAHRKKLEEYIGNLK